jgi:flagellar assembly protein FliH
LSRNPIFRSSRSDQEFIVHLDGRLQEGTAPPPCGPEDIIETAHAADLVDEARRRADELLAEATSEVAEVREAGHRQGRDEGYLAGMNEARAELADALALVQTAARFAQDVRNQLLAATETEIIELVIDTVQAVIGERLTSDDSFVLLTVERALQKLGNQNAVRVRVHPQDVAIVSSHLETRTGAVQAFDVFGDGTIGVGGCVIDTAAGEIDARLDVQLDAIARALRTAVPDAA